MTNNEVVNALRLVSYRRDEISTRKSYRSLYRYFADYSIANDEIWYNDTIDGIAR